MLSAQFFFKKKSQFNNFPMLPQVLFVIGARAFPQVLPSISAHRFNSQQSVPMRCKDKFITTKCKPLTVRLDPLPSATRHELSKSGLIAATGRCSCPVSSE